MIDAEYIQSLSDYLFWDTDKGSIDPYHKHCKKLKNT